MKVYPARCWRAIAAVRSDLPDPKDGEAMNATVSWRNGQMVVALSRKDES